MELDNTQMEQANTQELELLVNIQGVELVTLVTEPVQVRDIQREWVNIQELADCLVQEEVNTTQEKLD